MSQKLIKNPDTILYDIYKDTIIYTSFKHRLIVIAIRIHKRIKVVTVIPVKHIKELVDKRKGQGSRFHYGE